MPISGLTTEATVFSLLCKSCEETFHLGEIFGIKAAGGETLALIGGLGAGKTQLVKGLAKGLDIVNSTVSSPTYVLVHDHQGRLPLSHIDLYRLEHPDALGEFGLEEYFEEEGVTAIEWADKGLHLLPEGRLEMEIHDFEKDSDGNRREISIKATDKHHQTWVKQVLKKYAPNQTDEDTRENS